MKKLLCILLILIAFKTRAQDTYTIRGTVSDEKGEILPGATVFITNSKYVTATDDEGKFSFDHIVPGSYEVVIKILGYIPLMQNIIVQEKSVKMIARLNGSAIALKTVTIRGAADPISDEKRERYLALFIKSFIGETVNAQQCRILNPEVVHFQYDKDKYILRATTDELIIVENKALGYNLKYLLTEFEFDYKTNLCTIGGSPYFEALNGTEDQQKKWELNRRVAYLSSARHFFRAVMNNTAKAEGYIVSTFADRPADSKLEKTLLSDKPLKIDSLFFTYNTNFKAYRSDISVISTNDHRNDTVKLSKRYGLYVAYNGIKASPLFYKTGIPLKLNLARSTKDPQESEMQLLADILLIDRNGQVTPSKGIIYNGYWGWQRIADLTPLDYFSEPIQNATSPKSNSTDPVLQRATAAIDTIRNNLPVEKLYLQLDKPYYTIGDTLRFKSYLLNADYLTPSARSGLLYIELDDAWGRMAKRIMVPLASGINWGNIILDGLEIPEGSYTLRAYTNWMRNFGEDYIFKKSIYISGLGDKTLVKANFKLDSIGGKNKIQTLLRFTGMDKDPLRLKDMQLRVNSGRKTLYIDKVTTNMDGSLNVNFDLAGKTALKDLYIQAQNINKGADTATIKIPVIINRAQSTDVQFMPESGNLVAGVPTRIGLKAISEDGKSVEVKGTIVNSRQEAVTTFKTTHKGMGSFVFTPQPGEIYTAITVLTDNSTKNYMLPAVNATGTAMRITDKGQDSLEITLTAILNQPSPASINYYLIGQSRGVASYTSLVRFQQAVIKLTVAKDLFPTGITHFTLLNSAGKPLNERLIFINHDDNLQVNLATNQPDYTVRDSIALNLQVADKDGLPVQGTFSVAVTDDSQVRTDSLDANIINNLLFTSDLKGTVEEPYWYMENHTPESITALDNLLLTQGWVGYDWKQVFNYKIGTPQYRAEREFIIEGRVTNIFNKPVEKSSIMLFSQKPALVRDTVTDKDGRFVFKGLYPVDTAIFKLQARNKSGKSFNVSISMLNEFTSPVFTTTTPISPWYVNSDTLLLNNANTKQAQLKAESNYSGEGNQLKEVVIKAKKIIKNSKNIGGPGEFDEALDEQDMLKAEKMTLERVLISKIKGFKVKGMWSPCIGCHFNTSYMIDDMLVLFIFDGINPNLSNGSKFGPIRDPDRYSFLKSYMDYYTAEDIKGIEVMKSSAYVLNYLGFHIGPSMGSIPPLAFIEITTRGGQGPWMKAVPGTYLYKPLPYTLPKDFYRPRYSTKNINTAMGTDLRSTLHWEPNLLTDTAGKATVSFFSADKPTDYTVIIEGTDLNGNIGYSRKKIRVIAKTTTTSK